MNPVYPEGWRRSLTQKIAKRGVHLVLGDRIEDIEPRNGVVKTTAGERIAADLVVSSLSYLSLLKFLTNGIAIVGAHTRSSPEYQVYRRVFGLGDSNCFGLRQSSALITAFRTPKHLFCWRCH